MIEGQVVSTESNAFRRFSIRCYGQIDLRNLGLRSRDPFPYSSRATKFDPPKTTMARVPKVGSLLLYTSNLAL